MPLVAPKMSLAQDLDDAMSSPSADKLAALAVQARQTDSQTEMVAAGVHLRLPALLRLSQCSCGSPNCGTSSSQCGCGWRQMQAQCARLLGNLSYLQANAHPSTLTPANPNPTPTPTPTLALAPTLTLTPVPHLNQANKNAVVQAGGLDALIVASRGALHATRDGGAPESVALLLEATAALANLASGGATRRRCEDLDCEAIPLLLRCLRVWEPDDFPRQCASGLQHPPVASAVPLWTKLNAVAVEAARALSNLSFCAALHPRLLECGAIDALSHLSERVLAGPALLDAVKENNGRRGPTRPPDGAAAGGDPNGLEECQFCAVHAALARSRAACCRCSDSLAGPLLSRTLQMLLNVTSSQPATLADGTGRAATLSPLLLGLLAHAHGPEPGQRGDCAALRAPDLVKRLLAFCQRLLACAPFEATHQMIAAGLLPSLTRLLLHARLPAPPLPSTSSTSPRDDMAERASAPDADPAPVDAIGSGDTDDAVAPGEAAGADAPVLLAVCSLLHQVLRGCESRAHLLSAADLPSLLCALHTVWSNLPPFVSPAAAGAAAAHAELSQVPGGGLCLRSELAPQLRQLVESLCGWSPGLCARALAALEPQLWSDCTACHNRVAATLSELAVSPTACHDAGRSALIQQMVQLLHTAAPHTVWLLLRTMLALVANAREVAVPLALAGVVPLLVRLQGSRRCGSGVRKRAAELLCEMSMHGELLMHCLQHDVLSCLSVLLTHADSGTRERAAQAALALVSPHQAFLPLISNGEGWVALQLLHGVHRNAHTRALSRQVEPLLREHYMRQAPLLHSYLREHSAIPDEQKLHATLILLRLGPCPLAASPDPQPSLRLVLRHALVNVERDREEGVLHVDTEALAVRRARGRRHTCACVIAHVLRAERARRSLMAPVAPPLGVLAAQALFSAMEAEPWPNAEIANALAAVAAPHLSFTVEQLELAIAGFVSGH